MPEPDLIELFVPPLATGGIRYLISGSVAAMFYGEPRLTHDIDMILFLRLEQIARLSEIYPPPEFYLPPASVIAAEMEREQQGHFNVIHTSSGFKADFYPAHRDEFHFWAFRNAKQYSVRGVNATLAPPEYVIVRKLEYFREGGSEKHLRDIRAMLAVSGEQLDRENLEEWVRRLGVGPQWKQVGE